MTLASFFNIILVISFNCVRFVALVAWSLRLPRLKLEQRVRLRLRDQPGIPQGPQEALALLNVRGTEIPRIVDEVV